MQALIDGNAFYVACERVFQPRLWGKPVGVLSNNDSSIIARSNELKALGVEMGTPAFQLPPRIKRQAILLSANYALVGDMSARVNAVLAEHSPRVLEYSIDESFLDYQGFPLEELEARGRILRADVLKKTGIPTCVGFGDTKLLAKTGNRCAKKMPALDGMCVLKAQTPFTTNILKAMAVTDLWGIARRTGERLAKIGIRTAWDLHEAEPRRVRRACNVNIERMVYELRGIPAIELDDMDSERQQIMVSRSFGQPVSDLPSLQQAIRTFTSRAGEKLRRQQALCPALMVFIRTGGFNAQEPQYSNRAVVTLPRPSFDTRDLLHAAQQALEAIYRKGYRYKKAGVMLLDLTGQANQQLALDDTPQSDDERQRDARLMATLDNINREMGRGAIQLGTTHKREVWHTKANLRSPRYTTRWDELPVAKS